MISTDRKHLELSSAVLARTLSYAEHCESVTVVVAGVGSAQTLNPSPKVKIVFAGGSSFIANVFTLYASALAEARVLRADRVTVQDPFVVGLIGTLVARKVGVPVQVQVHTDHVRSAFIFESFRHIIEFLVSCVTLSLATCVRVVSESSAKSVRRFTRAPVSVLPIAIDTVPLVAPRERPREFGVRKNVVTVSRLAKEKNIDLVIKALAHVEEADLFVVGDGPLRESLQRIADSLQLTDRVHFLGWRDDAAPYYQHADCFVQASAYEGYGMSLMAAVIAGAPCVSTPAGVARDLPPELVTIVPKDEYAIARAIRTTFHQDSEARSRRQAARSGLLRSLPDSAEYAKRYISLIATCGSS